MSVFLGWMPDAATRAALAELQQRIGGTLPAGAPRHDWRTPAQWHMTLRYLGNSVDAAQQARIASAVLAVASHHAVPDASLVGVEYWPQSRVLVGVIEGSDALDALLTRLEHAMQASGFPKAPPQTAHITLARLAGRVPSPQPVALTEPLPLRIDRIHLLRTVPKAYLSLASWPVSLPIVDA